MSSTTALAAVPVRVSSGVDRRPGGQDGPVWEDAPGTTTSYDDHQREAVLVTCSTCGKSYYMTVVHETCQGCR